MPGGRGDVGTWGRRYRCREDANHGKIKLENTKGIGLPIPSTFVPTSPRLPEGHVRSVVVDILCLLQVLYGLSSDLCGPKAG